MGFFSKLAGVTNTFFQFGGPGAPGVRSNSTALEARNSANSALAVFRVATPVGDTDAVTKQYVDTTFRPFSVGTQFSGSSTIPSNTSTESYSVVTTTGVNASIGQLIWDDGTNTGTATVLTVPTGGSIVVTASLTGGTISFAPGTLSYWSGSSWIAISASTAGVTYMTQFAITNSASQSSATNLTGGAIVYNASFVIGTPYSGGGTLKMGISGTTNLFMDTTDVFPQTAGTYEEPQVTAIGGSAAALLVTVGGSPAAGAGTAQAWWSLPNN